MDGCLDYFSEIYLEQGSKRDANLSKLEEKTCVFLDTKCRTN